MPPTYVGQRCGICEHLSPTQSVPRIDQWLACEVELSSTLQASRRLSAMKIFNLSAEICDGYAATKSQVGLRHMRTRDVKSPQSLRSSKYPEYFTRSRLAVRDGNIKKVLEASWVSCVHTIRRFRKPQRKRR